MPFAVLTPQPVAKAKKTPTAAIGVADRATPAYAQAIADWLRASSLSASAALPTPVTLETFAAWVTSGALIDVLENEAYSGKVNLQTASLNVLHAGAHVGLDQARAVKTRKAGLFSIAFDLVSPTALRFIETYMLTLISSIDAQTRENIRNELIRSFQGIQTTREVSRRIREFIGLTPQQLTAVANYRKMLETGKYREALQNALRDARFDPTLLRMVEERSRLSQDHIEKMVGRYVERYLNYRAQTIARTETIRISRVGQQEAWRQAIAQGFLENPRQEWVAAEDERSCKACPEIPGMNPQGVGLDQLFDTPYGPMDGPPAHTLCRCSVDLLSQDEVGLQ